MNNAKQQDLIKQLEKAYDALGLDGMLELVEESLHRVNEEKLASDQESDVNLAVLGLAELRTTLSITDEELEALVEKGLEGMAQEREDEETSEDSPFDA